MSRDWYWVYFYEESIGCHVDTRLRDQIYLESVRRYGDPRLVVEYGDPGKRDHYWFMVGAAFRIRLDVEPSDPCNAEAFPPNRHPKVTLDSFRRGEEYNGD